MILAHHKQAFAHITGVYFKAMQTVVHTHMWNAVARAHRSSWRDVSSFRSVQSCVSHKTEDLRNPRNSCIRLHRPTPMILQASQCRFVVFFLLPMFVFVVAAIVYPVDCAVGEGGRLHKAGKSQAVAPVSEGRAHSKGRQLSQKKTRKRVAMKFSSSFLRR